MLLGFFPVRAIKVLFLAVVMAFLPACITSPPYSPLMGQRFVEAPVSVGRIAIIFSAPFEYRDKVLLPMASKFPDVFKGTGVAVSSEVQTVNPLALGGDVNFFRARQAKPDAYLIVKVAGGSMGASYSFNLVFELLNSDGKGLWRGSSTLRRLSEMDMTGEQIAREILRVLVDEQVIRIQKGEAV